MTSTAHFDSQRLPGELFTVGRTSTPCLDFPGTDQSDFCDEGCSAPAWCSSPEFCLFTGSIDFCPPPPSAA